LAGPRAAYAQYWQTAGRHMTARPLRVNVDGDSNASGEAV